MEAAPIADALEADNVEEAFCELPAKQLDDGDVTAEAPVPPSDPEETDDKELTWEKIAAEITEENIEGIHDEIKSAPAAPEVESEPTVAAEAETVINSVTETENVVTEVEENVKVGDAAVSEATEKISESLPSESTSVEENEPETEPESVPTVEEPPDELPTAEPVLPEKDDIDTIIEISELKPEDTSSVSGATDDFEYTVVEADEVETNEIIEEHLAQSNTETETIVVINSDQTQTEITIEQVDDDDKLEDGSSYTEQIFLVSKEHEDAVDDPQEPEVKAAKPKKQRGRKPITDIPLHVLGRDISKPTEGVSNGGRIMPKPRLGVKVPYRNLTSQIVSKEDIEKEIMERFKLKQEQNAQTSGDILFARKLTQRLARKLIPTEKDKAAKEAQEATEDSQKTDASEIKNNSDLIAILEGDDDMELDKKETEGEQEKKGVAKTTEKEIALQQLKELPGKNRIFKSRGRDDEEKKNQKEAAKVAAYKPHMEKEKEKEKERKSQVDMEPRLKTGMVIKTYTRKRRSTDTEPVLPFKKSVVTTTIKSEDGGTPTSVYVTKSSRVIKRKVIWDPDEVPTKNPVKSPKMEPTAKPSPTSKIVEKKEQPEKKTPTQVKKIISKSPPLKKPKRLTEVDKLLMDEGAINMLYDVKTNDDSVSEKMKKKSNKSVISLDKAHKDLMSKTSVIKNDLQQNTNKDVQKSLRKKEVASSPKKDSPSPVTRKKSKDSVRSSVHSPPASPPYIAAEASRIIRRHSSSSFSSNDELEDEEGGEERVTRKKSISSETSKKKTKKNVETKSGKDAKNNNTVAESKPNHVDKKLGEYETFTATRKNHLFSIKLANLENKCYLSEQVLTELMACLKSLGEDDDCHVVSITSNSNESFCDGLDYSLLVVDDEEARQQKAAGLALLVKDFLRCLLNFPKVLVAGIQGDCVGLGVTMLPLFDMVVASDSATFSAPYSRLGSMPEAGFLLTVPYLSSNGLASELLYAAQIVKADDAFRRGLVTRLCWPEKYHQELKAILGQVANQSRQSIVATKQQLRQHLQQNTEETLSSMEAALVENWTSKECQKSFSK